MIHDAVVHKITRRNPFLQDWPYYGIIDILNPVATAQYQHGVTISTKPGMLHDFRDLRFFQPDGSEIPFWIESKTDGSTAFVWFKPYSVSNRQAYVFYGNREAVSQSNGDKVFEFFDDFLGSSLDATKWSSSGSGISVSGSTVTIASAVGNILGNVAFSAGYAFKFYGDMPCDPGYGVLGGADTFSWGTYAIFGAADNIYYITSQTSTFVRTDIGTTYTGTRTWELRHITQSSRKFYIDGAHVGVEHTATITAPQKVLIRNSAAGGTVSVYWVLVRKYTATEPVCQLNQSGLRNPIYR